MVVNAEFKRYVCMSMPLNIMFKIDLSTLHLPYFECIFMGSLCYQNSFNLVSSWPEINRPNRLLYWLMNLYIVNPYQ